MLRNCTKDVHGREEKMSCPFNRSLMSRNEHLKLFTTANQANIKWQARETQLKVGKSKSTDALMWAAVFKNTVGKEVLC